MAVKIRLTRKGKKKQPTYRVVVADGRSPRDGRYIEQIGRYDPRQEPSIVVIDNERAAYWMSVGAQPSDAVRKLLEISGALEARPVKIKDPKVHVVDEAAQADEALQVADAGEIEAVIETAAAVAEAGEVEAVIETAAEVAEDNAVEPAAEADDDATEASQAEAEPVAEAEDAAEATAAGDEASDTDEEGTS